MSDLVEQFNVSLASRISEARKAAGKTQQQIADALGCHVNIIQRFETGKHRISAYDLSRLAEAVGVPFADLLHVSGSLKEAFAVIVAAYKDMGAADFMKWVSDNIDKIGGRPAINVVSHAMADATEVWVKRERADAN